jgi:hypothetical protein
MLSTDRPTTIIWGTQEAPAGTVALYSGYAMGPYYNYEGPVGPICVDSTDFEDEPSSHNEAILHAVSLYSTPGEAGYTENALVSCVVVQAE